MVAFRNSVVHLRIFAFVFNVKFSEPNNMTFTSWSTEKIFQDWFIVYIYIYIIYIYIYIYIYRLRGIISGQCVGYYSTRYSDL